MKGFELLNKYYNQQNVYIIAEIGANHNQDLNRALVMIEQAANAGANAVKFQSIKFEGIYKANTETEEFKRWFSAIELNESWYGALANKAKACNVHFLSSPTYEKSIALLESEKVPAYKVASPQAQADLPLVKKIAATGKPMIISMGYGNYSDIDAVINACEQEGNYNLIPLHCVSQYPVNPKDANLNFIPTLSSMTGYPVGFSDHSMGDELAIAAVTLGACVIEKHVTQDRSMEGPDHKFAMHFDEFKLMVSKIRNIESALGASRRSPLQKEENGYRDFVAHKLMAKFDINENEKLTADHFTLTRSNNTAILASDLSIIRHCQLAKAMVKGQLLQWSDLKMDNQRHV